MRFLFVDRIVQSIPGKLIRGVKHITNDDFYLSQDTDGRFYFFSSLIGETLGQLAAWNVMAHCDFKARPVAGVVASAVMHKKAYVGQTLLLESFIDCLDETAVQYHSQARIGDEIVFAIDGALGPLLPMDDFIPQQDVRAQYHEIYRLGDWDEIAASLSAPFSSTLADVECQPYRMQFDRILTVVPGVSLSAEKRLTRQAPYFPDHFPKKPVLPMTVLLECKLGLAQEFLLCSGLDKTYQIREMRKIKMNEFVCPGDVLTCHLMVKQQTDDLLILSLRSEVANKRVCVLEVVLTQKGH